jgi:O-antigen ligase
MYLFVPVEFWQSTLDLVSFERVVQGIPTANTLWDVSLLGQYGVGDAGTFPRAVGPFTHPVGTAHYFVLPLLLAVAAVPGLLRSRDRRMSGVVLTLVVLFAAVVITPISRANWIAAAFGVVVLAITFRTVLPSLLVLAAIAAFIVTVPPFRYSVTSAVDGRDSSIVGHQQAIDEGLESVRNNPVGLGVGQADQFGEALSGGPTAGGASAGIGENMYLSIATSIGPIGVIAFVGWLVGVGGALFRRTASSRAKDWMALGTGAALIAFSVSALSGSPLMRFTTSATFWLLVGIFVALRIRPAVSAIQAPRPDVSDRRQAAE